MKRLHKILLVVLTVSLLLGAIVVSAMASSGTAEAKIGDTEYATVSAAVAAANGSTELGNDVTVTLLADATIASVDAIKATRAGLNLTVDLNGKTLTASAITDAAIVADVDGTALTVKNGTVIVASGISGVVKSTASATISLDALTVVHKGSVSAPTVDAAAGTVNVTNSLLEAYGVGTSVICQGGNAVVNVSDTTINSKDGSSALSTAVKVVGNATLDTAKVTLTGCVVNAANAVVLGALDSDVRAEVADYFNVSVEFENCDVVQVNSVKYNENLLDGNRNAVTYGDYFNASFVGCNVKFARAGFYANDAQTILVSGGTLSMTFDGQSVYMDAESGITTDCENYIAGGTGTVTIESVNVMLPCNGDVTLDSHVSLVFGTPVLTFGENTTFNVASTNLGNYVPEGYSAVKRGVKAGMMVVSSADNESGSVVNYLQALTSFETLTGTSITLREPIVCLSKGAKNADGSAQATPNNNRVSQSGFPLFLEGASLMTIQGIASIQTEADGNKYYCYDPTYVYNPYDNANGVKANKDTNDDGINDGWDLNGDGILEYQDTNGDGVADKVNIGGTVCDTDIPEKYTAAYHSFQCYIGDNTKSSLADLTYYSIDFDYRTAVGSSEFFALTTLFPHGRTESNGNTNAVKALGIKANGDFGTGKLNKNTWNHITMLVKVVQGNATMCVTNYYLDGVCVGSVSTFTAEVAAIYGGRAAGNCATSGNALFCIDNVAINAYNKDYSSEEAAALFESNGSIGEGENAVLTYPNLDSWADSWYMSDERVKLGAVSESNYSIGTDNYSTFNDAYAAAKVGDTITLNKDVDGIVDIEKAIIINNAAGVKFMHTSEDYKAIVSGNLTIFSKANASEKVAVNFYESETDVVTYTVAKGNYVKYTANNISTGNLVKADSIVSFKGWGESVAATTYLPDVMYVDGSKSSIDCYAIFTGESFKGYTFAVVNANGTVINKGTDFEAFMADNANVLSTAGQTIVLFSDVELSAPIVITASGRFTIDINGYTVTAPQLFESRCNPASFKGGEIRVIVYSSRKGGTIDIPASSTNGLLYTDSNNAGPYIYYHFGNGYMTGGNPGHNLIVKTGRLHYQSTYRTNVKYDGVDAIVNGATPIYVGGGYCEIHNSIIKNEAAGQPIAYIIAGAKEFTARNSTFIGTKSENGDVPTLFTNPTTNNAATPGTTFANCNIYDFKLAGTKNRTHTFSISDSAFNVEYEGNNDLNTADAWMTYDAENYVIASGNYRTVVFDGVAYKFTYALVEEDATVTVTWNVDGQSSTETYIKGGSAYYPGLHEKTSADGFYTMKLSGYASNNGVSASNLTADVTLTPLYENVVVNIPVLQNVTITDTLALNVYVPVGESIKAITVGSPTGKNLLDKNATKDGYYVIPMKGIAPNQINRTVTYFVTVQTPVGDVVKSFTVSILDYAADLLESNESAESKALVAALLNYANEACIYFNGAENADIKALLTKYEALVPATDLTAAKSTSAVASAVESVYFSLKSQTTVMFKIASDFNGTVTINGVDYTVNGGDVVAVKVAVKNLNKALTITVNGASAEYDLATYAAALTSDPAYDRVKALYDFAAAAAS